MGVPTEKIREQLGKKGNAKIITGEESNQGRTKRNTWGHEIDTENPRLRARQEWVHLILVIRNISGVFLKNKLKEKRLGRSSEGDSGERK